MKHIALLTTGGTIASQEDEKTGLQIAGVITGEALFAASGIDVSTLGFEVSVHSVFQLSSSALTYARRDELIRKMERLRAEGAGGFVITQGTDTMEEVVYYLALHWPYDEPVVVTGSQIHPAAHNTDAFHNLFTSLQVAADDRSIGRGVQLVFNNFLLDARYVTKWHTANINGFGAPQCGPSGIIDEGQVYYYAAPRTRRTLPLPAGDHAEHRVEIVPCYVDMDPAVIDFWQQQGVAGLVVDGFGRGQVTVPLADKLKKAAKEGLPVVITSACLAGFVAPIYGYDGSFGDLLANGIIGGGDFAAKKARILLHALLMAGVIDRAELAAAFGYDSPY